MDPTKRKFLEAAGWRFGDAAEFRGMTDEERQRLAVQIEATLAVWRQHAQPEKPLGEQPDSHVE